MTSPRDECHCQHCGKAIGSKGVQGLCPACLLKVGLGSLEGEASQQVSFSAPAPEDLAELFSQLDVMELIGAGGMGAVYKARQRDLDRLVALKILAPRGKDETSFAERFTREARALARLNHPHIVGVHDFGQVEGLYYFVMEYVDGTNLRQVQETGTLEPREALAIIPQICTALQFAHDQGVVHRDIKPENILLDKQGQVKIADFGLAKMLGREQTHVTLTREGHVMGTPHYMAPEQVEHPHQVDHRADIYSLGVVFYEMLTGELPMGTFLPPSQKVAVDVRLDEVVLRALAKEPQRRYQQVDQVRTEVQTIVDSSGSGQTHSDKPVKALTKSEAKQRLMKPTRWLIFVAILDLIPSLFIFGYHLGFKLRFNNSLLTMIGLELIVLPVFILVGVLQIRRLALYRAGIVSSWVAMLYPPFTWLLLQGMKTPFGWTFLPGFVVGVPVGVWTLLVLSKAEVRLAFPRRSVPPVQHGGKQGFEYRSQHSFLGLPWLHIATGVDPETGLERLAQGVVAIGGRARGILAVGGVAVGGLAFGGVAVGGIALGGLSMGILAIGGVAVAAYMALGGAAIGWAALGGGAIGHYAYGGGVMGEHLLSSRLQDPEAVTFFEPWAPTLMNRLPFAAILLTSIVVVLTVAVSAIIRRQQLMQQGEKMHWNRPLLISFFTAFCTLGIILPLWGQIGEWPQRGAISHRGTGFTQDENAHLYTLAPVVTNLRDPGATRYIRVGLTIRISEEVDLRQARILLDKEQTALKHDTSLYFSGKTVDQVQGEQNRRQVLEELKFRFNGRLLGQGSPLVSEVLVAEWATQ